MKIKYLALDLDGTLTNSRKQVSEKNREWIRRAQHKGVEIILASGRPLIGVKPVADALALGKTGGYILSYNGGQIVDCRTGEDLYKKTIPMECVHTICDVIHHFPVYPLCYNSHGVICENNTNEYVVREGFNNGIPVIRVNKLEEEITEPVVKFLVVGEPAVLIQASEYLKEKLSGRLNIFFSEPYFMEIVPMGIEKASALEKLLGMLGADRSSLMACGDGLNDIPMLQYAGLAIAMENAYEETRRAADFVVSSNEADGVAEAIQRFILEEQTCLRESANI